MTIRPIFHCDGPNCTNHVDSGERIPFGWLYVQGRDEARRDFCSWDCILGYAAQQPPMVTIHVDDVPPLDGCDSLHRNPE